MSSSPVIFIHYGASPYLYYTLRCAKKFNPGKKIILLGDVYNKLIAKKCGVDFYYMKDWAESTESRQFDESYRFVAGAKHGRQVWTNFVFRRWFIMHHFLRSNNIQSFWTFDSDTMILAELSSKENYLKKFDNTEQCGGRCLNGFINSFEIVDGYINSTLATLNNKSLMMEIEHELVNHPEYAFTEMKTYEIYKQEKLLKTVHLVNYMEKETFDDCICFQDGMELSGHKTGANFPKKIFSDDRAIYFKDAVAGNFIKANTINLSWVPDSYFAIIYEEAKKILASKNNIPGAYREIELQKTSFHYKLDTVFFNYLKFINKIKRTFLADEVIR